MQYWQMYLELRVQKRPQVTMAALALPISRERKVFHALNVKARQFM